MNEQKITFDKLVRWVGIGALILAVLYLVNYLSGALLPFFIAWLFAYLLYPIPVACQSACIGHHRHHDTRHSSYRRSNLSHHSPYDRAV